MKLLFFISSMSSGGAERVMAILTNEFAARGHAVTLAIMTNSTPFYSIDSRVKILNFPFKKRATLLGKIVNRSKMMHHIRRLGITEKPDVIISFIYQMNTIVLLSNLFRRTPIIISEHNTLQKNMTLWEKIQRLYIARLAAKVTILTDSDYKYLGKRLKNKVVIYNPISFIPLQTYNSDRKKTILAVGSIDRYIHKGFDNLVDIWCEIADDYSDWSLKIAGAYSDDHLKHLKGIEEAREITNKIQYLGPVSNIDSLMSSSSIFVLSSRWEGFPMVLLEAMSQGCACISYDVVSGPREIIKHNKDGILVQDQNKEEMRNSLKLLMENEIMRKKLAQNALHSIKRFSPHIIVRKWEDLFYEVAKL